MDIPGESLDFAYRAVLKNVPWLPLRRAGTGEGAREAMAAAPATRLTGMGRGRQRVDPRSF